MKRYKLNIDRPQSIASSLFLDIQIKNGKETDSKPTEISNSFQDYLQNEFIKYFLKEKRVSASNLDNKQQG